MLSGTWINNPRNTFTFSYTFGRICSLYDFIILNICKKCYIFIWYLFIWLFLAGHKKFLIFTFWFVMTHLSTTKTLHIFLILRICGLLFLVGLVCLALLSNAEVLRFLMASCRIPPFTMSVFMSSEALIDVTRPDQEAGIPANKNIAPSWSDMTWPVLADSFTNATIFATYSSAFTHSCSFRDD